MNEFKIRGIPAGMVDAMWKFAEPYIKRALDHSAGEISPEDLRRLCREKDAQLFLISQGARVVGAATTEVICYPRKKHLSVITMAGSQFADWVALAHTEMFKWGQDLGCDALECRVRKGLVPKMQELGFKHLHSVVLQKLPTRIQADPDGDTAQQAEARDHG